MKKVLFLLVAVVVAGGAYWFSMQQGYDTPLPQENTPAQNNTNTNNAVINGPIGVASGPNGERLTDKNGFTLYVNIKDEGQTSGIKTSCNAQCELTWKPFLLGETEAAITGSTDPVLSKLNLFTRTDGKKQYALGTKPLYTNVNDLRPGDVNGSVTGDWMVARP